MSLAQLELGYLYLYLSLHVIQLTQTIVLVCSIMFIAIGYNDEMV
jgi:hypothetical protein